MDRRLEAAKQVSILSQTKKGKENKKQVSVGGQFCSSLVEKEETGSMLLPHHQISPNPLRNTAFAAPFALQKGEWKEHFIPANLYVFEFLPSLVLGILEAFFLMKFDSAASDSLIPLYGKLKTKKSRE